MLLYYVMCDANFLCFGNKKNILKNTCALCTYCLHKFKSSPQCEPAIFFVFKKSVFAFKELQRFHVIHNLYSWEVKQHSSCKRS